MYYGMTNRRYGRRTRARLRLYYIYCNGGLVGTSMGDNSRSALMSFCRFNGIPFVNGDSYGACGELIRTCADGYNGLRPCGRNGKCEPIYGVPSTAGLLMAIMAG